MLKKSFFMIYTVILSILLLCSCGNKKSNTESFDQYLTCLNEELTSYDNKINSIDVTKDGYEDELLSYLDELDVLFQSLPEQEAPSEYPEYTKLAEAASYYMSQAVHYYHLTFDDDDFNPTFLDTAADFYDEALQNIRYIGYLRNGYDVSDVVHDIDTDVEMN